MEALGTEAKENKRVPSLEGLMAWPGGEPAVTVLESGYSVRGRTQRLNLVEGWEAGPGGERRESRR